MIRAEDEPNYHLTVRQCGVQVYARPIHDPFHRTEIRPRGWRNALRVLFGRYVLVIHVTGTDLAHRAVFGFDYTSPKPEPPVAKTLGEAVNLARGGPAPVQRRGFA